MAVASVDAVEALLTQLYLGDGAPREEDRKKARAVADLLALVAQLQPQPAPRGKARLFVDGAAGHGYVGLCAAALLGWRRVVAVERDERRAMRVRAAAASLPVELELEVIARPLEEGVPRGADIAVALHACGGASDAFLRGATRSNAKFIVCVPCCYGVSIDGWDKALAEADTLGLADVRQRFAATRIDAERLAHLREHGYETSLRAFTAPTVTPHNLAIVGRRSLPNSAQTR